MGYNDLENNLQGYLENWCGQPLQIDQTVPPVSYHQGFNSMHLKARPRMWPQEENLCLWQETRPATELGLKKGRTPNILTLLISLYKKKLHNADTGSAETNMSKHG